MWLLRTDLLRGFIFSVLACYFAANSHALSFDEVKDSHSSSETLVLDRHGEILQRVRTDLTVRRGSWVPLRHISPALRAALVLSEDKRFYEHSGVDWRAVSTAAWANLWNTRTRGASTLTMQLAGLLDEDLKLGAGGRSFRQKIGQAVMATRLESGWRKDQILEAYLNLVPFRGELVGIDALARTLFAKAPHGLNDSEAALAAALVRSPNARPAMVAARACGVLKLMRGPRAQTDCMALDMQAELILSRRAFSASEGIAPHLARHLLASSPEASEISSTLDAKLQRVALESLQRNIKELRGRNVEDGAVVVLDNANGEVLAWVGSTGSLSSAAEVDGVLAMRQPGSTLKPFLYGQAIAERRLTAASLLDDSPAYLQTASGLYIPQNYDRQFKGWVSARTALASSLNVPAVRTLTMVSPGSFVRQLQALGIELRESGDYYGYSLALGSAEVSLLQLTNAYRALANGGRYSAASYKPSPEANATSLVQALAPSAAFIVTDILSDANARARTFGTDSILATRFWTAVKTGTSKDMRDNWAVGYSQRYTVGVWVGNASGKPMWDVSGTSGAAPVWAALMNALHARTPSNPPMPPKDVVKTSISFGALLEASRDEWFIAGTDQSVFTSSTEPTVAMKQNEQLAVRPRILTPVDGTILALDPDIPPARQRLTLTADPGTATSAGLRWYIGNRQIGHGPRAQWLPWPGRHKVQLRDALGVVQQELQLEVRGAQLR